MGKMQREKGKRGEREARDFVRCLGFGDARRGQQHRGGVDSPDVVATALPFHLEAKRTETLSVHAAVRQAKADAGERPALVWSRRSREEALVHMTASDFVRIVTALAVTAAETTEAK